MGVLGKGNLVHGYGEHLSRSVYDLTRGERKLIAMRRVGVPAAAPIAASSVFSCKCFGSYPVHNMCSHFLHVKFTYTQVLIICLATEKSCFYCRLYNKTFVADLIYNLSPALNCPPVYFGTFADI